MVSAMSELVVPSTRVSTGETLEEPTPQDPQDETAASSQPDKPPRWLGWVTAAAVLLAGGGGWWFASQSGSAGEPPTGPGPTAEALVPLDRPQRVEVTRVTAERVNAEMTYPGVFRAAQTASLAFRVSGPLVEVAVDAGDRVQEGDVLMRIDPRDFQKDVEAAEAAIQSAQAELQAMRRGARQEDIDALEARLDTAIARLQYLNTEFERNKRLLKENAVPLAEFDASEAELAGIRADVRVLETELRKAKTGERREEIEAREADLRGLESRLASARDRLADTVLYAPFDGLITARLVENYEPVQAGQTAVSMHDIRELEIDVSLPEKEVLHRPLDQQLEATLRLLSLPERRFTARLKEIETKADTATRTYLVTFAMPAPSDVNVFPGMVANVTLSSLANKEAARSAITVPLSALQSGRAGGRFVWAVDGDLARRRDVKLGSMVGDAHYEVTSGLEAGEPIVTVGGGLLHDGARVVARRPAAEDPTAAAVDAG